MKSTKSDIVIQSSLKKIIQNYQLVYDIVHAIERYGGNSFLVGGAVRDLVLGNEIKDLDIEIHNVPAKELAIILKQYGHVDFVGKAFGVFKIRAVDVDWSLPRVDSSGRKPDVMIDPSLSIKDALQRRDLTMNAMAINLITYEFIDPFNGLRDIHEKILCTPDPLFFVEDPLRFFRVMQFIGRFEMFPDDRLNAVCKTMDVHDVSVERIEDEFNKLFLKSQKPSLGIRWLHTLGRLRDIFPELAALVDLPQDSSWHPEGDVFEHTMQTVDAAAVLPYNDEREKLIVMYAALCHDLGKILTTERVDGVWKSLGHEREGVVLTKILMHRITHNKMLIDAVCKLVTYHLQPEQFITNHAKLAAYKRLARKLGLHVTLQMLAKLALADKRARNPKSSEPLTEDMPLIDAFLEKAQEAHVLQSIEKPILLGRDLIDVIEPGPKMGQLVKKAYEIQLEEGIQDKEELKRRVLGKE